MLYAIAKGQIKMKYLFGNGGTNISAAVDRGYFPDGQFENVHYGPHELSRLHMLNKIK